MKKLLLILSITAPALHAMDASKINQQQSRNRISATLASKNDPLIQDQMTEKEFAQRNDQEARCCMTACATCIGCGCGVVQLANLMAILNESNTCVPK